MTGYPVEEWIEGSPVQTKQSDSYFTKHDSFQKSQRISRIAEMFAMPVRALTGWGEQELEQSCADPSSTEPWCRPEWSDGDAVWVTKMLFEASILSCN